MRKLPFIFSLVASLLIASENIEVIAKEVIATGENFFAYNDVLILYDGAMLHSDSASYEKNSSLLTLEGDVELLGLQNSQIATNRVVINTKDESVTFKKLFITGEENVWIDSSKATKKDEEYKLFDSRVSSCNMANPDWTIEFKEAHYRHDKEFITMEDARVRFYDTTIFYFPYLAFPTVHKRTTGLLLPRFKISDTEGFLYEQPFFYAPEDNWDIEFNPQVRVNRGLGAYLTTRFVDSNHSEGYFRTGYFKNFAHYYKKHNLNREHLGVEFFYHSNDILPQLLSKRDYKSGLYIDSVYLNDREYLNLQKERASALVRSNLIESRFNAFVYDESNYFGLYGRYNIDTSQVSNKRTLQEIPSLHYHHYLSQFFNTPLFYAIDGRLRNHTRVKGSRAYQGEIDMPITYYDSFFNDYLDFSVSENLYLTKVNFRNLEKEGKDYYYYRNFHTFQLSSDLNRAYGDVVHTLHPSIAYVKPSFERESDIGYSGLTSEQQELFVTQTTQERLSVALSQYFLDISTDSSLFHKFGYISYPNRDESNGDMINEIGYNKDGLGLYSSLTYAWDKKEVRSLTSMVRYNQSNYDIMLTHFYNNDFLFDDKKSSFVNTQFRYNYSDKESWFINMDYDLKQHFNHEWKLGWQHVQPCWSAALSIGQETIPNIDDSFRNTALYFELNLNPIGGIEQNIESDFSTQGKE